MTGRSRFLVQCLATLAPLCSLFCATACARGDGATTQDTSTTLDIAIHLDQPPKPISPDLFGIFFEDINYAADGGLYGELIRRRRTIRRILAISFR
jgi:hypothetical protein